MRRNASQSDHLLSDGHAGLGVQISGGAEGHRRSVRKKPATKGEPCTTRKRLKKTTMGTKRFPLLKAAGSYQEVSVALKEQRGELTRQPEEAARTPPWGFSAPASFYLQTKQDISYSHWPQENQTALSFNSTAAARC